MAESNKKGKTAPAKAVVGTDEAKKPDLKKIAVVVVVIAVIVAISLFVDYNIKNPSLQTSNDASNRLFAMGVLRDNPEITTDTPVEVYEDEPVEIEGGQYYPVHVVLNYDTPEAKGFLYYVAIKNGKIYTMDEATEKLIPYGV